MAVTLTIFFASGIAGGWLGSRLVAPPPAVVAASPCAEAQFVSEAFGYCVDIPAGWVASPASAEPSGTDLFRNRAAATEVRIEAVALPEETDLEEAATGLRAEASISGHQVTALRSGTLGGERALTWQTLDSGERLIALEIVVERSRAMWRLRVAPMKESAQADLAAAGDLLVTWRFA